MGHASSRRLQGSDQRIGDGEVAGLGPKRKRGYGRWVREAPVWTKALDLFRNELVAVDGLADEARVVEPGEVKLGRKRPRDRAPGGRRW